jgi:hypothetical protein
MEDPFEEIRATRSAAESHVGFSAHSYATASEAAIEFGLHQNNDAFVECNRSRAELILYYLLRYDLAYGSDCMTDQQARSAIDTLMAKLPHDVRFYTNGNWDRRSTIGEHICASGTGWVSATDCTFDGGILVVGRDCAACVWFGDED